MPAIILKILSAAGPVVGISQRWQVWFNNSNLPIPAKDVIKRGYGVNATVTRVVFRAPYKTPESQVVMVGNYHIDVLSSNTMYTQTLLRIIVDTTLACPNDPPVFSNTALSWLSPTIITPLILGEATNVTFDMGINGKLIDSTTIENYNYKFHEDLNTVNITVPYGASGGHVESDIVNNTYVTMYKINLLLQRNWVGINEDDYTRHTSYKPVVAPFIVQTPIFLDHTIKENLYFNVSLGNFYSDMDIQSFIIHNVPLALDELGPRRMTVMAIPNKDNTQAFYLTVPFSDPVVEQTYLGGYKRRYRLYVTYIMTHVTKNKILTHPGVVECVMEDVVPPKFAHYCLNNLMVINMTRGNMDYFWLPYIRDLPLNDALIQSQNITVRNSQTTLYIEVPYTSVGVIYEVIELFSSTVSLAFTLRNNLTQEIKVSHFFNCSFPTRSLTCLSNGTMFALVDGMLAKPAFDAHKAHLRDPKCTPQSATSKTALFIFTAFTCGTTRRFENNFLVYENEVTFDREVLYPQQPIISRDSSYRLTVRCTYPIRETLWVGALNRSRNAQPALARTLSRVLRRRARTHDADLKLAKDDGFTTFYQNEDFPVSVQPAEVLYFQAGVHRSEPVVALKDCWATTSPGLDGITRWGLILDGCGAGTDVFSAEVQTSRDLVPRFTVTVHEAPSSQFFIHCVVLICEGLTPPDTCPTTCNETRRFLDKTSAHLPSEVVSAGPVQITAHPNSVAYRHVAAETKWTWVLSLGLAVISAFIVGAVFLTIRLYVH